MVTAGIFPFKENSHGRAGNRTRDLRISSQRLWPLDHEAGPHPEVNKWKSVFNRRPSKTWLRKILSDGNCLTVDITGSGVHTKVCGEVKLQSTSRGRWQLAEHRDITDEEGEKSGSKSEIPHNKMSDNYNI